MKRRGFLMGLLAAPVAAVAAKDIIEKLAIDVPELPLRPEVGLGNVNNFKGAGITQVTGLASPTEAHMLATKRYVDAMLNVDICHQTFMDTVLNKQYIRQTMADGQWSDWKEMSDNDRSI